MDEVRSLVDPDGRYPAAGLRTVEKQALEMLHLLPGATLERTRDVIQIDFGGDSGIVVIVTPDAIELRLPTIEWTGGSYGPAESSRLWKRVEASESAIVEMPRLLAAARAARRQEFTRCRYCRAEYPPERMHSKNVCHGCAERHEGVVH